MLVRLSRAGVRGLLAEDCVAGGRARESFEESRMPMPGTVAFTAVHSRRDGIVDWRACIRPLAHAVGVRASHVGMAVDPRVVEQVLAALARHRVTRESVVEVDRGEGT